MTEPLINIHIVIAQTIASILCIILVFIIFSQTIYYLCIRKLIHTIGLKDELELSRFTYDKKSTDDIHPFFRITTSISMLFCFICSISSLIAITHLMITGSLSYNINYIRFICFISWLFSHYSMSSVFVGRLYVSFKDSIFQYPIKIIRILSISLASLPILLIISFLFWLLENNNLSLIFFISFIGVDVAFSIILTWLFVHKLYQLIKGRIMTRSSNKSAIKCIRPTMINRKSSFSSTTMGKSINNSKFTIKSAEGMTSNHEVELPGLDEENETCITDMPRTINKPINTTIASVHSDKDTDNKDTELDKDITPYLGPVIPIEPTFKMELPSIADEYVPELHLTNFSDGSYNDPEIPETHSNFKNTMLQTVPSHSIQHDTDIDEHEMKQNIETINSILGTINVDTTIDKNINNDIMRMDMNNVEESHGQLQDTDTPMPSQQGTPIPISDGKNMSMIIDLCMDDNDNMDLDTPIPTTIDTPKPINEQISHTHTNTNTHTQQRSSSNKLVKPNDINTVSGSEGTGAETPNSPDPQVETPKAVRFSVASSTSPKENPRMNRERSDSRAKRYMKRAASVSKSISTYTLSPRHSKRFIKAKKALDPQQLQLINSITRHGLLLFLSTFTSLTCLIYIMLTFQHYESMDIKQYKYNLNKINMIAYYYLYWNMGISSFLNGLSLYLSFAFAQWFYMKVCNRIHKWLEAFCVIVIVKRLKRNNSHLGNIDTDIIIHQ